MTAVQRSVNMAITGFTLVLAFQNCAPSMQVRDELKQSSLTGQTEDSSTDTSNQTEGGASVVINYGKATSEGFITSFEETETPAASLRQVCATSFFRTTPTICTDSTNGSPSICSISSASFTLPKGSLESASLNPGETISFRSFEDCSFAPAQTLTPVFNKYLAPNASLLTYFIAGHDINQNLSSSELAAYRAWRDNGDIRHFLTIQDGEAAENVIQEWFNDREYLAMGGMANGLQVVYLATPFQIHRFLRVSDVRDALIPFVSQKQVAEYLQLIYGLRSKKSVTRIEYAADGYLVNKIYLGDGSCSPLRELSVQVDGEGGVHLLSQTLIRDRNNLRACD